MNCVLASAPSIFGGGLMPKRRPTAQDHAYLVYLAMTGDPDPDAIEELAARLKVLWWHWRLSDGRRSVQHER